MRHPVYRAFDKPVKLLAIAPGGVIVCFFASLLTWGVLQLCQLPRISYVAALSVWGSIHYGCWKYLNEEPQLFWLLLDKYTLPDALDPLERTGKPGIQIIHEK